MSVGQTGHTPGGVPPKFFILVDVSDIFNFFCSGRGIGSYWKSQEREGFQEGEGPRGREGVCGELGNFWGGAGGLFFFFRGRNVHQVMFIGSCLSSDKRAAGSLRVPNGVFQTVFLDSSPRHATEGKRFRGTNNAQKHQRFWAFWCLLPLRILTALWTHHSEKEGKDPHPQDKIQHLDFTKDPRPLYYKTPPCAFYHRNVCSKAVFGP